MEPKLISPPKPTRTVLLSGPAVLYNPAPYALGQSPPDLYTFTPETLQVPQVPVPIPRLPSPAIADKVDAGLDDAIKPMLTTSGDDITEDTSKVEMEHLTSPELLLAAPVDAGPSLESRLVDRAIENMLSLPEVCGQVAVQQRDQTAELRAQQGALTETTQKLKEVRASHRSLREELSSIQRQVYLSEQRLSTKTAGCRQLEDAISRLVSDNLSLQREASSVQTELGRRTTQYEHYAAKMAAHRGATERVEQDSAVYRRLAEQRAAVEGLDAEKASAEQMSTLMNSGYEQDVRKEIISHQRSLQALQHMVERLERQIKDEDTEEMGIQQSIEVLHKRNTAQLTRLRKRMKEVHGRNRYWKDQARQLQQSIDALSS